VRNGETIVLGGLTQKNENDSSNKVPVLADLPIIGQFFRSLSRNVTNSELLIFVTPTILDDQETTGPGGP
jgi:type II secretory pathway component GspD/PulD (secretin)